MIFDALRLSAYYQAASFFPKLKNQLLWLAPKFLFKQRDGHMANTLDKVLRRMKMDAGRPDLIDGLLRKGDELNMTIPKLQATSESLITAGSESTATLLSGVTYLLLKNPDALRRLTEEVRTTFENEKDIDFLSVSSLEYMLACLDEALRIYPPAAAGFPRVVPQGGGTIAGHFVPEGVSPRLLATPNHKTNHSLKFAGASLAPLRLLYRYASMPCTTMRNSSRCLKSSTLSAGWATLGLPTTTRKCFSPSNTDPEAASGESRSTEPLLWCSNLA